MSCARYHELISRYADNEVTPRQRQELLRHVDHCHDCAAWLARVRQAEVLLRGVPETRPSDRVRSAVFQTVRQQNTVSSPHPAVVRSRSHRGHRLPGLLGLGFLLRFDPSPRRIAVVTAACLMAITALAYQFNLLSPFWSYDKLGFEIAGDTGQALNFTPIPAISSGYKGVGGPVAVPNLVRLLPEVDARDVSPNEPVRIRFDQPMDRASVERTFKIDPPVAGKFGWDADNEISFSPDASGFLRGVTYSVTLSNTARSLAGTPLGVPISWAFQTRDMPSVNVETLPSSGPILPASLLTVTFSTPMEIKETTSHITLRAENSGQDIPLLLTWHDGISLTVAPKGVLPLGTVSLLIGTSAKTLAGENLGRPYAYTYDVTLPLPRLRLLDNRLQIAAAHEPLVVKYEAVAANSKRGNEDDAPLRGLKLDLYGLTADRLSTLGDTISAWPGPLPSVFVEGLQRVDGASVTLPTQPAAYGTAKIENLHPGIYLAVVTASHGEETFSDWQVLVVPDSSIAPVGVGDLLWASDPGGHAWPNAEVSLYSSSAGLIEKGITDAKGLWHSKSIEAHPAFVLAQDGSGNLAAVDCRSRGASCGGGPLFTGNKGLSLETDQPSYLPGQQINFDIFFDSTVEAGQGTPVAEQDVDVSLVMPGGLTVAALKLKPASAGAVSGLFNLSPALRAGRYVLHVKSGASEHDFPITIEAPSTDTLSVFIADTESVQAGQTYMTNTVTVLGAGGEPAANSILTATLRIFGDEWVSRPIVGRADRDGRATFVLPLPSWLATYNEPGLYVNVEAVMQGQVGSSRHYQDLTSVRSAQSGMRQLVSPGLGIAAVARPMEDGALRVRVVTLGDQISGDLMVVAEAPTGEQTSWSLDLSAYADGDLTLPLTSAFASGRIVFSRVGVGGSRELSLLPAQNPDLLLQLNVPRSAEPGSAMKLSLSLLDRDGQPRKGTAAVWFRRVSGVSVNDTVNGWVPGLSISDNGHGETSTVAPTAPGLWYVMARAATPDGLQSSAWSILTVTEAPVIQVPPRLKAVTGEAYTISTVIHNPTGQHFSGTVQATGGVGVAVLRDSIQHVDVAPGGWQSLSWSVAPSQPGVVSVALSFGQTSGVDGTWHMALQAADSARSQVTYVSGSATGERLVGVKVPSGLSDADVELEIHASTSLLTTLASIAIGLPGDLADQEVAARLSGKPSIASAYRSVGGSPQPALAASSVERSMLLQQIYAAQQSDGGWPISMSPVAMSSMAGTANLLLSLRRSTIISADISPESLALAFDASVLNRGLAYLYSEASRPLPAATQVSLDERANALYVLSLYGMLQPETARPMMAYITDSPDTGFSYRGQSWLALALLQSGDTASASAIIDRIVRKGDAQLHASPSLLEALIALGHVNTQERLALSESSGYDAATEAVANALMGLRQGLGWRDPQETADALWALSRYAVELGEKPQRSLPSLVLNDQPVQAAGQEDASDAVSLTLSGDPLHAGTNWLKIKTSGSKNLYYSLTLRARR